MPFLDFLCVTFSGFAATRVDFTSIVTRGLIDGISFFFLGGEGRLFWGISFSFLKQNVNYTLIFFFYAYIENPVCNSF